MGFAGCKRIALVAGNGAQTWPFISFARIALQHEVRLHAFESSVSPLIREAGIGMAIYASDPVKPGYMTGLERQLEGVDLVVAAGSENLASFQALRACLKSDTPFHCIAFETAPHIFDSWSNIRAIRHDILGRSDVVWTLDRRTIEALEFERYSVDRVREMPFAPDRALVLSVAQSGRARFRRHIGIADSANVMLYEGSSDPSGVAGNLARALQSVLRNGDISTSAVDISNLVVVVATPREGSERLKYLIADLGVARNFRFLHQDTTPFAFDLVASSDLWFLAEPGQSSSVLHLARLAALSGTKVLLSPAAGQCDMAGSSGFTVMDFSAMALARLLKTFERRSDGPALLADPCPYARAAIEFDGIFSSLLVSTEHENQPVTSQTSAAPSWHDRLSILESPGMRQGTDEVLHEVEHLLLLAPPAGDIVSRLHACKGTALFTAGNLESATDAFRSALAALAGTPFEDASSKESQQASKCYKALAQIALAVHSYQEALDLFRRAHALYPADLETCSGIGAVYRKLDLHEEALHWLGRSVSEDRSSGINEAALVAFTQTLLACPDRPAAIRAVNQLTSIIGEHPMLEKALDSMADG